MSTPATQTTRYAYHTSLNVNIIARWCPECGIPYGVPEGFIEERQENHKTWYCPNGCRRHFPEGGTEAEQLRKQLDTALKERDRQLVRANGEAAQRRQADRQRAAAKGQVTKMRRRVGRGVCPCCNRTFADVARHMENKHPDFLEEEH